MTIQPASHSAEPGISVGELSRRTGVTTATINYYVRLGVLPSPVKTSKTRAIYPTHFENLISRIKQLQEAGLNLAGIKQVVNSDPNSPLAAAMPPDRSTTAPLPASGPISIADLLEQSGLESDLYDNLLVANLIRGPRT